MKTYIALLRGINVSGKNIIQMKQLRTAMEENSFQQVQSYIQSGNIIFKYPGSDAQILSSKLHEVIKASFGLEVPVFILLLEQLEDMIRKNPFQFREEMDPKFFHLTFLEKAVRDDDIDLLQSYKAENEDIAYDSSCIYLYCPNGYGKTKLNNQLIESKTKSKASTRNWKTINKIVELATQ